jgi:hypothetical protein
MTYTLAYYDVELIMAVKSFTVHASDVNLIKRFTLSITLGTNKLERLCQASILWQVNILFT